jgi:DNA-binding NarL/FixJ family response regulator
MEQIRIAIADDHKLFSAALASLINQLPGMEVVFVAADGEALIKEIETKEIDVLLLDINMPNLNGIEATKILRNKYPDLKIIIISMYENKNLIYTLVELGVNAYLLKTGEPEEVGRCIHSVVMEGYFLNDQVTLELLHSFTNENKSAAGNNQDIILSEEDLLLLKCISQGKNNVAIAKQFSKTFKMSMSPRTVDRHKTELANKLGVHGTFGVALFAWKSGLVD